MCQTCRSSEIGFPKDTHCRGGREKWGSNEWRGISYFVLYSLWSKITWTPETTEQRGFGYTAASKQQVSITTITTHTQHLHVDSVTPIINYCVLVVITRSKAQPWPQPRQQAELWHPVVSQDSKLTKTASYVSSYYSCSHQRSHLSSITAEITRQFSLSLLIRGNTKDFQQNIKTKKKYSIK